jgi:hypothetical protein
MFYWRQPPQIAVMTRSFVGVARSFTIVTTFTRTSADGPPAPEGGKRHEMPAHHTLVLEAYLDAYIEAAKIRDAGKAPLFRSAVGRTAVLTEKPMHRVDACAADLDARVRIGCHTVRATGITAYLEAGGTLENAQAMAAHESPRTTKLYDRTGDEITLDEVERIAI